MGIIELENIIFWPNGCYLTVENKNYLYISPYKLTSLYIPHLRDVIIIKYEGKSPYRGFSSQILNENYRERLWFSISKNYLAEK